MVAVVAALLIWLISRSVAGPIATLTEAMGRLAARDWTAEVAGTDRTDEIGTMATALQVFKESGQAAEQMQSEMETEPDARRRRPAHRDARSSPTGSRARSAPSSSASASRRARWRSA